MYLHLHEKNDSATAYLKNLDVDLKIILLGHQNNYVERSSWLLECRNFLQQYSKVFYIIILT